MLKKQFYLVVGCKKSQYRTELNTPRIVVGKPNQTPKVNAGEIAILMSLELPEALFQKPKFTAKIAIPEGAVAGPVLEAQVVNDIVEAVRAETGLHLTIQQVTS